MKQVLGACLAAVIMAGALHAGVVNKDEAKKVKKIAVVSFYSTKNFLCYEPKTGSTSPNDYIIKDPAKSDAPRGWKGINQSDAAINDICRAALNAYQDSLAAIGYWEVVPFDKIKDNPAYINTTIELTQVPASTEMLSSFGRHGGGAPEPKAERKTEAEYRDMFRVMEGMRCLPADMFREAGTTSFGSDPYQTEKKGLSEICKGLGVDGAVIIRFNPSFRYGSWARVKVGEYVKARPRIGAGCVIIGADGKVVAETGDIVNKLGWDFEGDMIDMIKNDELMLSNPEVKNNYMATIAQSAGRLKEAIAKDLPKSK
jgi:hypothetical protein